MKQKNDEADWVEWGEGMEDLVVEYFKDLFSSPGCITKPILRSVQRRRTEKQIQQLIKEFDASKIKEAIFSIHPDKSPGPNNMNMGFYQAYWDIIGGEVTSACLRELNNGELPGDWNNTLLR